MDRRRFLAGALALAAAPTMMPGPALAGAAIAQRPGRRVIVDNDFAGDPDGLVALAHQLLSPRTRTVLVTSSALDPKLAGFAGLDPARTAAAGAALAGELLRRLDLHAPPAVVAGAESFGTGMAAQNAAARAIVAEALRDDPLPLFVACGGALSNVAAALRLDPAIARRMTVVWIGGSAAGDDAAEYNLDLDRDAARQVLDRAGVPVWQIPLEEYRRFQISVAELETQLRPISPAAAWLCDRYAQLPPFVELAGTLIFGDSPLVTATAFDAAAAPYHAGPGQRRMLHDLDPRLNFADFTALLRLQAARPSNTNPR